MSSLASSPSSAVRQASPVWLHPLKHALSVSPLSFPSYLFTQNHRSIWWNEIPESFVSHLSSLCSLPVLAERGARRWTIFCCAVNFGLHIFYSFAIATCVDEGSQQLCSVVHEHCNAKPAEHKGFWHLWKYVKAALSINMHFKPFFLYKRWADLSAPLPTLLLWFLLAFHFSHVFTVFDWFSLSLSPKYSF